MTDTIASRRTALSFTVLALLFLINHPAFARQSNSGLFIEGGLIGSPEVLFLSNLNLLRNPNSSDNAPLFQVTIRTERDDTCRVELSFTLFSRKHQINIVEVESQPFDFHKFNSPKTITNVNITSGNIDDIELAFTRFDAQLVDELQQDILRIGRLPNDRYTLTVRLEKLGAPPDENPQSVVEIIDVSFPTTLDLTGPGLPVSDNFCPDVYTIFPQFVWSSNAEKFILTVCEVQDGNASPEDVMQNEPRARLELNRGIDFLGTPALVYPTSGVWPLREGRTYYWQVQAVVESPSGDVLLPSEIRCFRIARLDDVTRRLMSANILIFLRTLFAGTPFEDYLAEGGPLEGYAPSGTVKMNGVDIDLFDLVELLKQAAAGDLKISNVDIE